MLIPVMNELFKVQNEIVTILKKTTDEYISTTSNAENWTISQIVIHLHLTGQWILHIIRQECLPSNREGNEKFEAIESKILQNKRPMKAAPHLIPDTGAVRLEKLIGLTNEWIDDMTKACMHLDFSEESTRHPHPDFGVLTRLEWLYYATCHGERHLRQMRKLANI